jgi:protein-tyrosine-phosphatase
VLPLPRQRPRQLSGTLDDGDLVITVCDRAHEELGQLAALHWSVPDPVPAGDPGSFDAALDDLSRRVGQLAPQVSEAPSPRPAPELRRDRKIPDD